MGQYCLATKLLREFCIWEGVFGIWDGVFDIGMLSFVFAFKCMGLRIVYCILCIWCFQSINVAKYQELVKHSQDTLHLKQSPFFVPCGKLHARLKKVYVAFVTNVSSRHSCTLIYLHGVLDEVPALLN